MDKQTIWIGGISYHNLPSGIAKWNLKSDSWTYFEDPFEYDMYNDDVRVIDKLKDTVYFGTELGLVFYNMKNKKWKSRTISHGLESNIISDLLPHNGLLYIATDEGLNWYDPSIDKIHESSDKRLDNVPLNMVAVLNDSTVILATRNGPITSPGSMTDSGYRD